MDSDLKNHLITVVIIILVAASSFGLGRLSVAGKAKEPVTVSYFENQVAGVSLAASSTSTMQSTESVKVPVASPAEAGEVVASKKGTKYHYPWCGSAKTIAEENKIYFKSIEEARAAGYTPAANCKGLK